MKFAQTQHRGSYAGAQGLTSVGLVALLVFQAVTVGALLAGIPGALFALGLGLALAVGARSVSARTAVRMLGGRPLHPAELPSVHALNRELARRAGLDQDPLLVLIPSEVPNALTVASQDRPVIGLTQGMLQQLSLRELAGVIGHEIGHIVHGDLKTMAWAQSYARITRAAGQLGLWFMLFGGLFGAWTLLGVGAVLAAGPVLATLLTLALSRQREFAADSLAVQLTGDPAGLAYALRRIERQAFAWQRMFGFPGSDRAPEILRTHPATEARVARLAAAA